MLFFFLKKESNGTGSSGKTSIAALKYFFSERRRKKSHKTEKSGQGEILRPEIERSDRPEARQNSGFGWRGNKKLKKSIYY